MIGRNGDWTPLGYELFSLDRALGMTLEEGDLPACESILRGARRWFCRRRSRLPLALQESLLGWGAILAMRAGDRARANRCRRQMLAMSRDRDERLNAMIMLLIELPVDGSADRERRRLALRLLHEVPRLSDARAKWAFGDLALQRQLTADPRAVRALAVWARMNDVKFPAEHTEESLGKVVRQLQEDHAIPLLLERRTKRTTAARRTR